jgi:type IV pilus assembly protein PilQ
MTVKKLFILLLLIAVSPLAAQNTTPEVPPVVNTPVQQTAPASRFELLKQQLDRITLESPGLEEPVDLSVSNVPLGEFLRALGKNNKVNISVEANLSGTVTNNFSNVTVSEVLIFLAKQYGLDYEITGNIIHAVPFVLPPPPKEIVVPKQVDITFDTTTERIGMHLKNDSLPKVTRAITRLSGRNLVFAPGLENKQLSIYLQDVAFDQAMDKLAFANQLQISKTEDGFYLIEPLAVAAKGDNKQERFKDLNKQGPQARFRIDSTLISLEVVNQPMGAVLENLFAELKLDYFLYSQINEGVTMHVSNVSLPDLLQKMFYGTKYTYRLRDSIYIIGERELEGLRETKQIFIRNRSVEKIQQYLPSDLIKGLEVKEFGELNSLVVSGSYPQIVALEQFIHSIDQPVPVVIIEVLIVDYQRNNIVSSGLEAGLTTEPIETQGQLYPALDLTLSSSSINELLQSFDGFGSLNLGSVAPNFYAKIKFLEDNGILNIKSTPKLSTLNGHEANISIGNTEYYVVEQTNITGVQNPIPITTRNYQQVEANFTLKIKPYVSSDEQVTLEIDVEQTDFTARISPEAPPGTVSRKFTSMIRVRNNDMILLGGLEEKGYDDSGKGVPLLSRIPIIKWLFSSRTRSYKKTKLNIFIKPTIVI